MATTTNTLPLAPHLNPYSGKQTFPSRFYEVDAGAEACKVGDLAVIGDVAYRVDIGNPTAATTEEKIIGVFMEPKSGVTSVAGDFVKIALVLPGMEFSANMVDIGLSGTEADTVAADATAALCLGLECNLDEWIATNPNVVVTQNAGVSPATGLTTVLPSRFAMQRGPSFEAPSREGAGLPRDATGAATINPRVIFTFMSSVFYGRMTTVA